MAVTTRHGVPRLRGAGSAAELVEDGRFVGLLTVRVCTHWDTLGPSRFRVHVNPQDQLQWHALLDDGTELFSDDTEPNGLPTGCWTDGRLEVGGRRLEVRWLRGRERTATWNRLGW